MVIENRAENEGGGRAIDDSVYQAMGQRYTMANYTVLRSFSPIGVINPRVFHAEFQNYIWSKRRVDAVC